MQDLFSNIFYKNLFKKNDESLFYKQIVFFI